MTVKSDAPPAALTGGGPNVAGAEKWASILGGGALATIGLRKGGPLGLVAALAGGALLARGVSGRCAVKRALVSDRPAEREVADAKGWATAALVQKSVSILKDREELYRYWRDFSNLASFMENIERIDVRDDKHSHWVVKAPAGRTVEWDAVVVEDEPGHRIGWASAEGASVKNAGVVEFKDATQGRGTEVHAHIIYEPPGGEIGRVIATLFQKEPGQQAHRDLRRFKMLMETGEVATTKAPDAAPRFKKGGFAQA